MGILDGIHLGLTLLAVLAALYTAARVRRGSRRPRPVLHRGAAAAARRELRMEVARVHGSLRQAHGSLELLGKILVGLAERDAPERDSAPPRSGQRSSSPGGGPLSPPRT